MNTKNPIDIFGEEYFLKKTSNRTINSRNIGRKWRRITHSSTCSDSICRYNFTTFLWSEVTSAGLIYSKLLLREKKLPLLIKPIIFDKCLFSPAHSKLAKRFRNRCTRSCFHTMGSRGSISTCALVKNFLIQSNWLLFNSYSSENSNLSRCRAVFVCRTIKSTEWLTLTHSFSTWV